MICPAESDLAVSVKPGIESFLKALKLGSGGKWKITNGNR